MRTSAITLGAVGLLGASVLASTAVFGIQAVDADATSTEPTVAAGVDDTDGEGSQPASPTSEQVGEVVASTSTPAETSEEPADNVAQVSMTVELAALDKAAVMVEVSELESAYYQKMGSYLQILRGNALPTYETGNVAEKLGKTVSDNVWVHVYEAPGGKGYQVFYEDADGVHAVGYGPEANERTFTRPKAIPSATSTPLTI